MINLNIEKTFGFISKEKVSAYEAEVKAAQEMLEKGTGKGNDFLGWLHLPSSITKEHLADLNATAKVLRDNCEVVIVAGIGGSYLGARTCSQVATTDTGNDYYLAVISQNLCSSIQVSQVFFSDRRRQVQPS